MLTNDPIGYVHGLRDELREQLHDDDVIVEIYVTAYEFDGETYIEYVRALVKRGDDGVRFWRYPSRGFRWRQSTGPRPFDKCRQYTMTPYRGIIVVNGG